MGVEEIYSKTEEFCPRGDFHPLIATEEQPVGGFGLGHEAYCHDDYYAYNITIRRHVIYKVIRRLINNALYL